MEDELRFTWGICAVCGIDADESEQRFRRDSTRPHSLGVGKELRDRNGEYVLTRRSMLCVPHQRQWQEEQRGIKNFYQWVRTRPDSHLLFHEWGMECPQCIPCPRCNERLPMKDDYICEVCRYGRIDG